MIIAVVTDHAVGGTFLNWSLHYLAGHKNYFHVPSNQWLSVVDSPLTDRNAHAFRANIPQSLESFLKINNTLSTVDTEQFHSMRLPSFERDFSIQKSWGQYDESLVSAINTLQQQGDAMIRLKNRSILWHSKLEFRDIVTTFINEPVKDNNDHAMWDVINKVFFNEDLEKWKSLNLTNIWDYREFIALNYPFYDESWQMMGVNFDHQIDHYLLDSEDLCSYFDHTVKYMMDYLKLSIDQDRLPNWIIIYKEWAKKHVDRLLFVKYFDQIMNYIINGFDMDLTRFNLDIIREATIQHTLIYKHNLNFKTWQLEKFTNTKQLHNLLEPNIHPITTY